MASSYQDFDRPYRRGVVLGLSLAELFLILLFLLLLSTIGFFTFMEEEKEKLISEAERNASILVEIEKAMGPNPSPKDFKILIEALRQNSQMKEVIENLKPLQTLETIKEVMEQKGLSEEEKVTLTANITEIINNFSNDQMINALKKGSTDLIKKNKDLEKAIDQLESSIPPGVMPSCWQKERDVVINNKKYIEQYIYDVLMMDDGVIVVERPRPTDPKVLGKREPPPIPSTAFGKKLSYATYNTIFSPLTMAGENKLIRDYSCRYYVYMYDGTSSKNNYKISLNRLEKNFLRYEAPNNERWPH